MTKLTRPQEGRIIGGVCQGLAQATDVDVTVIRVVMALLVLLAGTGPLIYLVAWAVIPSADKNRSLAEDAADKAWSTWQEHHNQDSAPGSPQETFDPYEEK